MQTLLDFLGLIMWISGGLVLVGLPLRYFLRLRSRAADAEQRASDAEQRAAEAELTVDVMQEQLTTAQREDVERARFGARPMPNPPAGLIPTFERLLEITPNDPFAFPIGWELVQGKPGLVYASFDPDSPIYAGNVLETARTRYGKDNLAFLIIWSMCRRNAPDRVQIYFFDGKKSDGGLWANRQLAHNLYEPALGIDDIALAAARMRELRQIREDQRVKLGVTKWSEIPLAQRPPLVIVFVSELDLLELGMPKGEKLEDWLNTELTTCLASGIVYIIGSTTVSNRSTRWRQAIFLHAAGFQDVEDAVEPNLGMTSKHVRELGGMSPIDFEGPGYFTVRINRALSTVRAPKLDIEDRRWGIEQLPRISPNITLPDPLVREKVSSVFRPGSSPLLTTVPPSRYTDQMVDPWLKHALTIDQQSHGMDGIPQPHAIPDILAHTEIQARRTALEAQLTNGQELADDDIIFLHEYCREKDKGGYTVWKLTELGAKRGNKKERRRKIEDVLGIQPVDSIAE